MMRDVVVVLPGIMGSTLAKNGKLVWSPSAGAVLRAIGTFGRSIKKLQLPEGIGDEHPNDGVEPAGLMPDLHVLPGIWSANIGYSALLDWLRSTFHLIEAPLDDPNCFGNFLPISYDWRLSNRYNGRRLKSIVEPALEKWRSQSSEFKDAKLVFICHSMGGLVARWYIDREGGAGITRKLITLGTPHRGALNALEQLVNGAHVGLGPMGPELTGFARSLPSLHQLLPEYACVETAKGLMKTTETEIPELSVEMVADAMRFHKKLDDSWGGDYDFHPIVGFRQPTKTTASITGSRITSLSSIEGNEEGGDGTVPRLSAIPAKFPPDDPAIRSAAERHGALQCNRGVLDELEFVLGARSEPYRASGQTELAVTVDELVVVGEPIALTVTPSDDSRLKLRAVVKDELGHDVSTVFLQPGEPDVIDPLPAGGYRVMVGGVGTAVMRVAPVTCPLLVWGSGDH